MEGRGVQRKEKTSPGPLAIKLTATKNQNGMYPTPESFNLFCLRADAVRTETPDALMRII